MNIENLKDKASKLKDDLSKNVININDINAFLDNILNDEDVKTSSETSPSNNKTLTENDIITLFKSFLKTKCNENGQLVRT